MSFRTIGASRLIRNLDVTEQYDSRFRVRVCDAPRNDSKINEF